MRDEGHVYRIAQKIDNYDNDKDGCIWGHILEFVEEAYLLGRSSKQKDYDLDENGVTSSQKTSNQNNSQQLNGSKNIQGGNDLYKSTSPAPVDA